jgi:hypothetical protein
MTPDNRGYAVQNLAICHAHLCIPDHLDIHNNSHFSHFSMYVYVYTISCLDHMYKATQTRFTI